MHNRDLATRLFLMMGGTGGNPIIGGLDTDARAVIAAMTITPNATRQTAINTLVLALKASSVWTPLGVLYIFAAADTQASLLNWKAPSSTPALATLGPAFTTDRGWVSDGVAAFIDTQLAWNSISGVAQDNAHIGGYFACGNTNSNAGAGIVGGNSVSIGRSGGLLGGRMNNATNTVADAVPATAGTHLLQSRSLSTGFDRYVDAAAVTASLEVSTAVATGNLVGLRQNTSYPPVGFSLRALHAGAAVTATDVTNIRNALQAYMTTVGAS